MRFRVRIRVEAWNANNDVINDDPPPAPNQLGKLELRWSFFCSSKYSPLENVTTNCTLKSISAQSKKVYQLLSPPRLYVYIQLAWPWCSQIWCAPLFLWQTSATQWPWICTTVFQQLDAFSQQVRLYGDIPETHQRKTDSFSPMWTRHKRHGYTMYHSHCYYKINTKTLNAMGHVGIVFKAGPFMCTPHNWLQFPEPMSDAKSACIEYTGEKASVVQVIF